MYIYEFKTLSSRVSTDSLRMNACFEKGCTGKYIFQDLEALSFACRPRQCLMNDLNPVFFLPSVVVEDGQTMNSVSVLARAQLGNDYDAIVLTGDGYPVCIAVDLSLPDIANPFSLSSTISLSKKDAVWSTKAVAI